MLYAGGSFVLMPAYEPRAYLDALAKYKCTYSRGVAAVFTMFLQHGDYLRTLDLSALRGMTIGSAVVTPGASRCGRTRASARQGLGKLRADRRRQSAARADRRPSGPARQPRRACARHRAQAGRRARPRCRGRRAADPMPLCLPRLLQRAGDHPREAHGWLAAHRRHLLQGQGRVLLFPQPRRRHVQLRRRERVSRRRSRTCCSPIPTW